MKSMEGGHFLIARFADDGIEIKCLVIKKEVFVNNLKLFL